MEQLDLFIQNPGEGNYYLLDDLILRCKKRWEHEITTYQIVDKHGNDIVIHKENEPGNIIDHGVRIITGRFKELIPYKPIK